MSQSLIICPGSILTGGWLTDCLPPWLRMGWEGPTGCQITIFQGNTEKLWRWLLLLIVRCWMEKELSLRGRWHEGGWVDEWRVGILVPELTDWETRFNIGLLTSIWWQLEIRGEGIKFVIHAFKMQHTGINLEKRRNFVSPEPSPPLCNGNCALTASSTHPRIACKVSKGANN